MRWSSLALILALTIFLTGCKKPVGTSNEILIGEYGSMSGAEATFGQSTHKGIMLAVDQANAAGGVLGKQIKVITEDDRGVQDEAVSVVKKLINRDDVAAILGEVASSNSLAGGGVCEQEHVPMISPSSTNPKVTVDKQYVFRVCFTDDFQGKVDAQFAIKKGWKKVAILTCADSDYSKKLDEFFKATFNGSGEIVDEETYNKDDKDYTAQLTRILSKNPDAVFLPGYYTNVISILQQARNRVGLKVPFLGGDGWDSKETLALGSITDGCYFSNHYSPEDPQKSVQDFMKAYEAKYNGETPDAMAITGYDAANVLIDSIKRAGSVDRDAIRNAIAQTKDFAGAGGAITIDANHNAKKPIVIVEIRDGKTKLADTIQPGWFEFMQVICQQLINGMSVGAVYALIALGYTMVYGVLRLINFAHGDVYMVGAVIAYAMATWLVAMGAPLWVSLPLIFLASALGCAALGFIIEFFCYRPLRNRPRLVVLITAIGVSLLLENLFQNQLIFGPTPRYFPAGFIQTQPIISFHVGKSVDAVTISNIDLISLALSVVLMALLTWFVLGTRMGLALRAVSYRFDTASLMGINTSWVISVAFMLGSALAAVAGTVDAMRYNVEPLMGLRMGIKAFVAAVLGGIGSVPGAVVGGLLMGLVETLLRGLILPPKYSDYSNAAAFFVLILVLLVRPNGLLGKYVPEKV